jgi:hypothetical protein
MWFVAVIGLTILSYVAKYFAEIKEYLSLFKKVKNKMEKEEEIEI